MSKAGRNRTKNKINKKEEMKMYKRKAYKKKYISKKKREKLYNREDGKINMYLTYGDGIIIKIKKT